MAACSKNFGAFTCCCCTCQANHDQHSSHPQQGLNPSLLPTYDHAHKAHLDDRNRNRIVGGANNAKPLTENRQHHGSQPHGKHGGQKSGLNATDDRFSDYISRAKVKIRALTMKQNAFNSKEETKQYDTKHEDQTKDAFSDYIKRVKIKIRKTTSIANRKSFKESKSGGT